ncbi:MAG TPA: hypothetical protein PLY32_05895 [Salinivirgaceae bacterium]|nr:hypothetical protein [Salinivirgaceae bacterium]HQA76635.1 hypothetical protein [Salinivirgaceae bacterium]
MSKTTKIYVITFLITLSLFWFLGVMRFNHDFALLLFNIMLFPFGLMYYLYEHYCMNNLSASHVLNGEIVQIIIFMLSVALQSVLYSALFMKIFRGRVHD